MTKASAPTDAAPTDATPTGAGPGGRRPPSAARAVIYATILLDAIGIGLIFPMMPDLMARVGAGDTASGAIWGGLLMAAYAAMQFVFAPIIGGVSDAYGRRPVLIAALATLALDYVLMALASTFWLLLIGRILAGIAGATYITATAYLADITPPERRAASFGLIGATFGVGFIMGPALGGVLASWGTALPFWVAAGVAAGNVAVALFVLPESLPPARRRRLSRADFNPFAALLTAFRLPGLALPLAIFFTFEFANMVYPVLWSFWTREVFGWTSAMIGLSFAVYGVGAALSQGLLLPALVARIGSFRTLLVAATAAIVAFVGLGLGPPAMLVLVMVPLASLSDMLPPTATAMMSAIVAEDRQGVLQGVLASLGSVAAVVAPLALTPMFHAFAAPEAPIYLPGAPFLAAAILMVAMLPLLRAIRPTS